MESVRKLFILTTKRLFFRGKPDIRRIGFSPRLYQCALLESVSRSSARILVSYLIKSVLNFFLQLFHVLQFFTQEKETTGIDIMVIGKLRELGSLETFFSDG
jgi:hypothetical protein